MKLNPIAANQTEIEYPDGTTLFFSFKTPVAIFQPGKGAITTTEKFSVTTSRHVNQCVVRWGATRIPTEPAEFNALVNSIQKMTP